MGREVEVAVTAGKLDPGPWEQEFYGEFDGKRHKRVLVKIIVKITVFLIVMTKTHAILRRIIWNEL